MNMKWVAVNTAQVERLEFVDDNVEAMTTNFHEEVYMAARVLRDQLNVETRLLEADFPYSERMVADVAGLLEEMGENSFYELEGMTCEYASGNVTRKRLSDHAAMSLDYAFCGADSSDLAPTSYLTLYDPDLGKHQHLRLGALRYIEASLLALNEAVERTAE